MISTVLQIESSGAPYQISQLEVDFFLIKSYSVCLREFFLS